MKTNYLILAAVVIGLGFAQTSSAQSYISALTYDVSIPTADTKSFTDPVSWIGFKFDARRFVQPNTTVGITLGIHVFDNKISDQVFHAGDIFDNDRNVDIWGTQYRYINSWPLQVNAFYWAGDDRSQVRPYLGAGFGTFIAHYRLDTGLNSLGETKWQFGASPEVGLVYGMGEASLLVKAAYNYGLSSGQAPAISYFTVGLGVAWIGY